MCASQTVQAPFRSLASNAAIGFLMGGALSIHFVWHKWCAYDTEIATRLQTLNEFKTIQIGDLSRRLALLESAKSQLK